MRAKIATALLILIGIISIYQPLRSELLRVSGENEVLVVLGRAYCLANDLPGGVQRYGSIIVSSEHDSNQLRRLYLMRYFLTPGLVSAIPDEPWVIGLYADQQSGLSDLQGQDWAIVKDCENGVFLLKR